MSNFITIKTTNRALCTAILLVQRSRRRHSSRYVLTCIQGPNKLVRGETYSKGGLLDRSLIAVGARSSKRPGITTFHFYAGDGPAAPKSPISGYIDALEVLTLSTHGRGQFYCHQNNTTRDRTPTTSAERGRRRRPFKQNP